MEYSYEPFDPSEEEGDDDNYKNLKEICDMMMEEWADWEPLLACNIDPEMWENGRRKTEN